MTSLSAEHMVAQLPLPLAQLLLRARHAKYPRSRHDNAYYLIEASLKLAAAVSVSTYLAGVRDGLPRSATADRALERLALPSLGQWAGMLRETAAHMASAAWPADRAGREVSPRLLAPRERPSSMVALFERIRNGPDGAHSAVARTSIAELVDALVRYRNDVIGHGAARSEDFYDEMAPLLLSAAEELLAPGALDPLGAPEAQLVTADPAPSGSGLILRLLRGTSGVPLPDGDAAQVPEELRPGGLAILGLQPCRPLSLEPLVRYRDGDTGEEVLFLNRDRNGRHVEFLSYTTGRTERDRSTAPALAAVLALVVGGRVEAGDLASYRERSLEDDAGPTQSAATPSSDDAGEFEILAELGRGGMGTVHLARQRSLDRLVALKTISDDLASDGRAVERFRREIRHLARCDHRNVVKVLASGTLPDGRLYYAMEYVPGSDLEQVRDLLTAGAGGRASPEAISQAASSASRLRWSELDRRVRERASSTGGSGATIPPLPRAELAGVGEDHGRRAAALVRDVARGLAEVHAQGIVHRDIKPANLLLTADGRRLVLMDFGLTNSASMSLTAGAPGLVGTLRYAAPEQLAGGADVGPATDVRGLGCVLWELVSRRQLFGDAQDERSLTTRVLHADVPRLRDVAPGVDRDLDAIVARATEARIEDRIGSAAEFARLLDLYLEGGPLPIRPPGAMETATRWIRRRRPAVSLAVLAAIAAAIAVFVTATEGDRRAGLRLRSSVDQLLTAEASDVAPVLVVLDSSREEAEPLLREALARPDADRKTRLHALLALTGWHMPDGLRLLDLLAEGGDEPELTAAASRVRAVGAPAEAVGRLVDLLVSVDARPANEPRWEAARAELLDCLRLRPAAARVELLRIAQYQPVAQWQDPADSSHRPSPEVVELVSSAGGEVRDGFAYCLSLPLDRFTDVATDLGAAGLRPLRLRPYRDENGALLAAAVWRRGAAEWGVDVNMDRAAVDAAERARAESGSFAEDIAAYPTPSGDELRFAVLWSVPPDGVRRSLLVAATDGERIEMLKARWKEEVRELTRQMVAAPDGLRTSCVLLETAGSERLPAYAPFKSWKHVPDYVGSAAAEDLRVLHELAGVQVELTSRRDPESGKIGYCGLSTEPYGFETSLVLEAGRDGLAEISEQLAQDRFRPRSISVHPAVAGTAESVTMLWERPVSPPSEVFASALRRTAAHCALVDLGFLDDLWPVLVWSPDPTIRSHLEWMLSRRPGLAPELAKRLFDETDVSVRRAILRALAAVPADRVREVLGVREFDRLVAQVALLFIENPDSGLHAAAGHAMRSWGRGELVGDLERKLAGESDPASSWFVTRQGLTLVRVPGPVTFCMGSASVENVDWDVIDIRHRRTIPRSFAMGSTEVTVAQFRAFPDRQDEHQAKWGPTEDCPIGGVTWQAAAAYCNWLSAVEELPPDQWCYEAGDDGALAPAPGHLERNGYRLPTEAEWEWACRSGTTTPRFFGHGDDLLTSYAWCRLNSEARHQPVALLQPNDLGLFDVYGNVFERCQGEFGRSSSIRLRSVIDDECEVGNPMRAKYVVVRGGSPPDPLSLLTSGSGNGNGPSEAQPGCGFRVARTLAR